MSEIIDESRFALSTVEEARALLERALAMWDEGSAWGSDVSHKDRAMMQNSALPAMLYATITLGLHRDVESLDSMVFACPLLQDFTRYGGGDANYALQNVLRVAAVDESVESAVNDAHAEVRLCCAESLSLEDPRALALVEKLLDDPDATVRAAAKKRLDAAHHQVWWRGIFSNDPTATLEHREAEKLRKPLTKLAEHLGENGGRGLSESRLVALSKPLPDAVALDFAGRVGSQFLHYAQVSTFVKTMLARPGSESFLQKLIASSDSLKVNGLARTVAASAPPVRERLVRWLVATALSEPSEEDSSLKENAATVAGEAFPAQLAGFLVGELLAHPELAESTVYVSLRHALTELKVVSADLIELAAKARADGYVGPHAPLNAAFDAILEKASRSVLRPLAERAILSDEQSERAWGLLHLLNRAHDPKRDGSKMDALNRYYDDPRLRAAVLGDSELAKRSLPRSRADLRSGKLRYDEARNVIEAIIEIYGAPPSLPFPGVVPPNAYALKMEKTTARDQEKERRALVKKLEPFLGPRPMRGRVTREEWDAYYAARSAHEFVEEDWWRAFSVREPNGPTPADREFNSRALADFRAGNEEAGPAVVIFARAYPSDESLADALEVCRKVEKRALRGLMVLHCERAHEKLGRPMPNLSIPVKTTSPPNPASEPKPKTEDDEDNWLDSDD